MQRNQISRISKIAGTAGLILASAIFMNSCKRSNSPAPSQQTIIERGNKKYTFEGTYWVIGNDEYGKIVDKQAIIVQNNNHVEQRKDYYVLIDIPAGSKVFNNINGLEGLSISEIKKWYSVNENDYYNNLTVGTKVSAKISLFCDMYTNYGVEKNTNNTDKIYILRNGANTRLEDKFIYYPSDK
jgi:hypothetical protein